MLMENSIAWLLKMDNSPFSELLSELDDRPLTAIGGAVSIYVRSALTIRELIKEVNRLREANEHWHTVVRFHLYDRGAAIAKAKGE